MGRGYGVEGFDRGGEGRRWKGVGGMRWCEESVWDR